MTLLVCNYDEAIDWYTQKLGFGLSADIDLGAGKRWVTVEPRGGGARLLLARAVGADQIARIGDQTGGRVFLFLETAGFADEYRSLQANGVEFRELPREEAYGTVAVFADLYGNLWDLLQLKP